MDKRLQLIRSRTYDTAQSEVTDGVSDLAVLVGTLDSNIKAALAIAALTRNRATFVAEMLPDLRRCAVRIDLHIHNSNAPSPFLAVAE